MKSMKVRKQIKPCTCISYSRHFKYSAYKNAPRCSHVHTKGLVRLRIVQLFTVKIRSAVFGPRSVRVQLSV